jgi:hypothetical protein
VREILGIVLPTFLAVGLGFAFGKWRKPDMTPVVDVAMYICVPALAFTSMLGGPVDLASAARLWVSALIVMVGTYLMARLVFGLLGRKHSGLYLPIVFMNTVNIPFPIMFLAFGSEGLAKVTLFYIPTALLVYSWGIHLAARSTSWQASAKEILKVPLLFASVAGLVVGLLEVQLPALLVDSLEFISQAAIPLVLIVLGVNMAATRVSQFSTALLASGLRMGVGLGLGFAAVALLGLTGLERTVVIFEAGMPGAAFVALLAAKYDNEAELVSSVVFLTTVAALVTVPLYLLLLR